MPLSFTSLRDGPRLPNPLAVPGEQLMLPQTQGLFPFSKEAKNTEKGGP